MVVKQSPPLTHGPLQAPQLVAHGLLQAKAPFPVVVELEVENLPPPEADS